MNTASDLADRLSGTIRDHDVASAIRKGDLSRPERWPLRRRGDLDAYRETLLEIAADAEQLLTGQLDERDRILADAVAYGGRATATRLETSVELTSINPMMGIVSSALTFLPRHVLVTADHGERYLTRVSAFAPHLDDSCERLVEAAADGIVPNERAVTDQIALIDRTLARGLGDVFTHQAPPSELDRAAADAWRADLDSRLADDVEPALRRLRDTLVAHTLPAARPDDRPGLTHLDGGDEIYRRLLWSHTSLDVSPEEVHATGLAQIDRLEDEYRALAGPLLGTDDIDEIYRRLRDDESMRYDDADRIVADATTALDRALAAAPQWFHRLPEAACTAHPIEQGALAFYSPPSPDGAKSGQFFFLAGDPSTWATYQLEAVTFHESIPGHHLQLALAIERDEVHPLMEEYLVPAYCEGWGLYTERLADEMGLYSSDHDRIGMLAADSMRACRLVVDTGLHALGWSRQQAIDYMTAHAPLAVEQIAAEIDRYIGAPGQACSYMIGRLAIDEARANAQQALGERFDIRNFHDVVLGAGSVPLDTLRRMVADWVMSESRV